ncbi:hypothetical protein P7F88_18660 [Vibrio hannami]|nr:hypothetical protein [Vibrio hannami]MDG3087989.1 hypothetical protein [Vibrio hannami]
MADTYNETNLNNTTASDIAYQATSMEIWDSKYRLKTKHGEPVDQGLDDTFKRVAKALSDLEKKIRKSGMKNFCGL